MNGEDEGREKIVVFWKVRMKMSLENDFLKKRSFSKKIRIIFHSPYSHFPLNNFSEVNQTLVVEVMVIG